MERKDLLINVILLAGRIMIESGADMLRVDDTLKRIGQNANIYGVKIFETTTAITVSIANTKESQVEPIDKRNIDLEKVARVNEASRDFQDKKITLEEMYKKLQVIDKDSPYFPFLWQLMGACLVGATLTMMYRGSWNDFLPTMVVTAISFSCYYVVNTYFRVKFVSEFLAALIIGGLAIIFVHNHFGKNIDQIIIGALMPLVPGVPLTNSVRDLLAGHVLSGVARAIEAGLSASALGFGIAFILRFM